MRELKMDELQAVSGGSRIRGRHNHEYGGGAVYVNGERVDEGRFASSSGISGSSFASVHYVAGSDYAGGGAGAGFGAAFGPANAAAGSHAAEDSSDEETDNASSDPLLDHDDACSLAGSAYVGTGAALGAIGYSAVAGSAAGPIGAAVAGLAGGVIAAFGWETFDQELNCE